jgi:L-serine/L-threonine ammonia-lyase
VGKLKSLGAEVVQIGSNWGEADAYLREELMAKADGKEKGVYVPPFDHPDIWAGAATLVDELAVQMTGVRVDGVVCNVGGGGLLCGIVEGLKRWDGDGKTPKVLAVETVGADALHKSIEAGELIKLPAITSIATSLGAPMVARKAFENVVESKGGVVCATVTDGEAVRGSVEFLEDARMLVEVACGATMVTAYNGYLRKYLGKDMSDEEWKEQNIVLVVCGGSNINLELLNKYRETYRV